MLNYIWAAMVVGGIITAVVTGHSEGLTAAVLDGGKSAVELCITMLGVVTVWSGIMRIGERAGLIEAIQGLLKPVMGLLFPSVPEHSKAMGYMAANFAANFLGLGWAATPPGLMAMQELKKLSGNSDRASKAMSMFLIINMSSVQLVAVNLIAYRTAFSSLNPAEITVPVIIATVISTLTGIVYAKIAERRYKL